MDASDACAAAAQFRDQRTFGYDASIRLVNAKGQIVPEKVDDLWEVQWELLFSEKQQESSLGGITAVFALVERFDIEPFSDFSAK